MEIKYIKISELKPYEKNAKKHSKKQIEQIANSIKEFGFKQPIVVDINNVIIVGHGRIEAAKLLGFSEVPCLIANDLTEEQIKAYRLSDNRLNESGWEMRQVYEELNSMSDYMVFLTGFEREIAALKNEEYKEPMFTLIPKFDEKYDLFCVFCEHESDSEMLINKFGLSKTKSYKNGFIGRSYVIPFKDLVNKLSKDA